MRRKTLLGKRILSFLLTFVLIFSQSGFVSLAEGEDSGDGQDEYEITNDANTDEIEDVGAGKTIYGNGTGGIYIDINGAAYEKMKNVENWGQYAYTRSGCAWFASSRVLELTGKGYTIWSGSSWWNNCGTLGFSRGKDAPSGKAIACYGKVGNGNEHVSIIEKVDGDKYIISEGGFHDDEHFDYGPYGYCIIHEVSKYEVEHKKDKNFLGYVYLTGGGTSSCTVTNTGVTNIAKTSATINATVSPMAYCSEVGFYLGTSQTNMQKHVENTNGNVISIWYDLGTGKWTGALSPGTTYYYKIYIVSGGKTYESPVDSFVTQRNPVDIHAATDIKDGGRYIIESVLSGKVIEVASGVDTDRKQLNVWEYTNDPWQSWIAVKTGDKYILKNAYTGKAMDVYRASLDEGAAVTQYTIDGSASQIWTLDKRDDGSYGIVNNNSGLAVDLIGFSKENGATLGQYIYYANNNQRWYFNEVNSNADVIIDTGYTDLTRTSVRINATLPIVRSCSDVGFYLGTSPNNMEKHNEVSSIPRTKAIWYDLGTGKWTAALSKGTTYYYQLYCVIDGVTYKTPVNNFTTLGDKIAPNIKQAYITNITPEGYTVVCEATDNVGVAKVCFPTWTDKNGQDDLVADWPNNTKATSQNGNTYYYDVKISAHNNERGNYTTHVYAFDADGNEVHVPLTVVVPTYITGVTLSKTSLSLRTGETATLTSTVTPSDATLKELEWESSNENVATVDYSGKVTAVAAGKATITAYAQDPSGKSASCEVTVTGSSNPDPGPDDNEKAKITVANVSGTAGSKVEVPVSIGNNPGIASAGLSISYDKTALTLSDIKAGKVFSSGTFDAKTSTGVVQWYYAGEEDVIKTNGELFRAVFTINSSAAKGSYDVSVGLLNDDSANFTDQNGTAVPVSFAAGKVSVGMGVKGDLTGDGSVAMGDVVKVARAVAGYITLTAEEEALADVTGDGKVAMGDVVKIARFVAGYIDSLITTSTTQSLNYTVSGITTDISDGEDMIVMAGEEAAVAVAEKKAKAGDTVEIPVEIKTNPGIASAALSVSYDAASLELKSIAKGEVFSEGTFTGDVEKNLVQWYDVSTNKDTTATGTIFTMKFAVKSTAKAGNYAIKVGYLDDDEANVTNINSENVKVAFTDGAIVIEGEGGSGNEDPDPVPAGIAEVEVGKASAEAGKTVEIPVEIKTNPGIASAALSVSYDSATLELKTITKGDVFANGTFTGDVEKNLIQWYDVSSNKDTTATGTLFTLGFSVKDDAKAGKYAVKLGCLEDNEANVTNINSESVSVNFVDGEVEVGAKTEPVPAGTAEIEAGKAQVNPGKTVDIPVEIKTNPGIAGLSLSISYNNAALTLKSINKGKVLTAGTFTGDTDKNLIQWYDVSSNKNTTDTGVMFTLGFEVNSNTAEGTYAVTVGLLNDEPSNATNIDSENVPVEFTAGEVKVVSGTIDPPSPKVEKEDPFCIAPDVTADTTELYLVKGQKFTMPETGWTSSNKKQVTVSKKGVVNAKKVTTTPVTLTKGDRTIKVYVTKPEIDKKLTISDGEEHKINLTYDAEHLDVYWYSSDPNVAAVYSDGVVIPNAAGSATITAYINSKAYKCKVKVVESKPFEYRDFYMIAGATKTLKIKGIKNPVWESDNTSVVTVNKNKLTAVSAGYATLKTTYEGETYRVYVYVEDIALDMRDVVQKGKNKYTMSLETGDERSVFFKDISHDVVFISNKSEVAYVDEDGYLIARKAGKAKLTAKVNGKTITLNVTVK